MGVVRRDLPRWRRAAELTGRRAECGLLDRLIGAVRAGESRVLVVHGEAGIGKSALLEYLAVQALGCRVVRVAGVQSEMELAFAGLHQLCAPVLDRLDRLPPPQRDALRIAFGLDAGPAPDRFLVGLAVLGLLSEVAEQQPLMCLVDDEQWLDRASADVLTFVARRLGAEPVGLVFAGRAPLTDLPGIELGPLLEADARALLDAVLPGPIDTRVRDQLVAEARGNPLVLVELPEALSPAQVAGGFGLPGALMPDDIFVSRIAALPAETRRLLLVAAADPSGDPALVWRAAAFLGIGTDVAAPEGLAEFTTRVRFRHPVVRSAAYRAASVDERRAAHHALAEVTDAELDPDRRAWHRAQAAIGPDAEVAAELERSAGRAQARGGLAAAAAFLHRAAVLTLEPAQRVDRALAAAHAEVQSGGFAAAQDLLAMAVAEPLSDLQRARVELIRGQLAYVTSRGSDAPLLLLEAARKLAPIDPALSRATYLDALTAAIFAGCLASPGGDVAAVARAARSAPRTHDRRAPDLLLDGTAAACNDGYAAGLPMLRRALAEFGTGMPAAEELNLLYLAAVTALRLWDSDRWDALSARHLQLVRETGALGDLPLALTSRSYILLFTGELAAAAALTDEKRAVMEATGLGLAPYGELGLAAFRGEEDRAAGLLGAAMKDMTLRGEGVGITIAEWADALLHNGLGRYPEALAAARRAAAYRGDPGSLVWVLVELIEAGVRAGAVDAAAEAYRQLAEMTTASGTRWALGLEARSHALLSEGDAAERLYRQAIAHLEPTRLRPDLARAHLLYGEWLRRERRRTDAREQLRTAYGMFDAIGMTAFADRAGRELNAAGGTTHRRATPTRHEELTTQEAQIAVMASDGLSNPDIATRLFISPRTVQYHLHKVFTKLGITSRSQLDGALHHQSG